MDDARQTKLYILKFDLLLVHASIFQLYDL